MFKPNETLDLWFPIAIGSTSILVSNNDEISTEALAVRERLQGISDNNWRCNTFNTLDSYDLLEHPPIYKELVDKVGIEVKRFAQNFGIADLSLELLDAWINIAEPGAFQEYHTHPHSHFSACYYVDAPEGCGDIVFRSPQAVSDMFPLPYRNTPLQYKTIEYTPGKGKVLVFRSNIEHMVERNESGSTRISIAFNFKVLK